MCRLSSIFHLQQLRSCWLCFPRPSHQLYGYQPCIPVLVLVLIHLECVLPHFCVRPRLVCIVPLRHVSQTISVCDNHNLMFRSLAKPSSIPSRPVFEGVVCGRIESLFTRPVRCQEAKIKAGVFRIVLQYCSRLDRQESAITQ